VSGCYQIQQYSATSGAFRVDPVLYMERRKAREKPAGRFLERAVHARIVHGEVVAQGQRGKQGSLPPSLSFSRSLLTRTAATRLNGVSRLAFSIGRREQRPLSKQDQVGPRKGSPGASCPDTRSPLEREAGTGATTDDPATPAARAPGEVGPPLLSASSVEVVGGPRSLHGLPLPRRTRSGPRMPAWADGRRLPALRSPSLPFHAIRSVSRLPPLLNQVLHSTPSKKKKCSTPQHFDVFNARFPFQSTAFI